MSNVEVYLIPVDKRPWWLYYPQGLIDLIEAGDLKFEPWEILPAKESMSISGFLRERLSWHLVPFAIQRQSAEFACFQRLRFGRITVVSDESIREYPMASYRRNFAEWLRKAKQESAEWIEEERRFEELEREKGPQGN